MHDIFDLSVIIVTWNSEKEIGNCIRSVINNTKDLNYEIIVVDNNSSDRTLNVLNNLTSLGFKKLKIVSISENTGYTKACNTGISQSEGKNILFLNPDTQVKGAALKNLMNKLNSDEKTGAVAPKLLNEDGSIQKSCRTFPDYSDMFYELSLLSSIFPNSRIVSRWKMNYFDHDMEKAVDQPMAAALMIKRNILSEIGTFDERYKMFFNDVDLCQKIHDIGYEIIFYPQTEIIHSKGISIYKDRIRMIKVWNNDCLSYFKKYHYNIFLYNWLLVSLNLSGYLRILLYKLKK